MKFSATLHILEDLAWTMLILYWVGTGFGWWMPTIPDVVFLLVIGMIILSPLLEWKFKEYRKTKWYNRVHIPWKIVLMVLFLISLIWSLTGGEK